MIVLSRMHQLIAKSASAIGREKEPYLEMPT
jgi:hypothetical protein